ncbi:hypothetical protein L484_013438 [Morus notabilis]|uniref:Uncharacterized protein n=1 Tax=Morus notabilis TaxID=981085 RepID=W9RL04_9ROSA|nr:hypothetical protein L484_013438 [Morus notabilis]
MACNEKIIATPPLDLHHQEPEEDALSFCDLPMDNNIVKNTEQKGANIISPTSSEDDQDLFEFFTSPEAKPAAETETIVFCGKRIEPAKQPSEYVKRPGKGLSLFIKKESFKKCQFYKHSRSDVVSAKRPVSPRGVGGNRSGSFRFGGGPNKTAGIPATGSHRYSRSGKGGSRKHKVMIGLVKLQPEMELSEIRKRQGRRSPAPMFPATGVTGEEAGGRSHWGILRPLWCRAHFVSALTKASFSCLSHA